MIYNDRVTLLKDKVTAGVLSDEVVETEEIEVPCQRSRLSHDEQMGLFGQYNLSSFKLHLQGYYEGIEAIKYRGQKRQVRGTIHHKNSTVIIV